MIAAVALAVMLAQVPLRFIDSGVDHGSRAGLVESSPFSCTPGDDAAVCAADDVDGQS